LTLNALLLAETPPSVPLLADWGWGVIMTVVPFVALVTLASVFVAYNRKMKKALALAQAGQQSRTRFLATMSHEIRTPLNAVIGFSEFLRSPNLKPSEIASYAEGINKASIVLLELINDVLDLSKLDSGKADVCNGVLDVRRLAGDLSDLFEAKAAAKGVKLMFELPEVPVGLALSPRYFRQALLNLVGNSVKFTDSGSIVTTFATERRAHDLVDLRISVSDTGHGISPEALPTIFDPFVQDIATRGGRVYEGTGLGLPIVRRIVEMAGGTVEVSSEVGKGTTFLLRIPEVRRVPLVAEPAAADIADTARRPASVIIVDDVPMNIHVLELHLKRLGIKDIRPASSGKEALALFAERPAELVLTDMWMPGMSGTDLARRLRVCGAANVRIVAVTADTNSSGSFDMDPFTAVVTKPVTREKLLAAFEGS